jgi:hypothetical protein
MLCGGYKTFTPFSPRRQTLLHQFQRDDNVRTLLEAIRESFEFAKQADVLRNLEPASLQAKFLDEMLECVSECAKFIRSYAMDVQVGTSCSPLSLGVHHKDMICRKANFEEYLRQS